MKVRIVLSMLFATLFVSCGSRKSSLSKSVSGEEFKAKLQAEYTTKLKAEIIDSLWSEWRNSKTNTEQQVKEITEYDSAGKVTRYTVERNNKQAIQTNIGKSGGVQKSNINTEGKSKTDAVSQGKKEHFDKGKQTERKLEWWRGLLAVLAFCGVIWLVWRYVKNKV